MLVGGVCVCVSGGVAFSMCSVDALSMTIVAGIVRIQLRSGMLRPLFFAFVGYAVAPAGLPPARSDSRQPLAGTWQHLSTHGRVSYLLTYLPGSNLR